MSPSKGKGKPCSCGRLNCEVDTMLKKTSELMGISLNGAALLLNALRNISEGLPPGFKAASATLLMIVQLVQDVSGVQADFGVLLHEICSMTIIVDNHVNKTGGEMSEAMKKCVKDLEYQLEQLRDYIQKMRERSRVRRFFFSPMDKGKVIEYRRHFDSVIRRFELGMGLDTNFNTYTTGKQHLNLKALQPLFDQAIAIYGAKVDLHPHQVQRRASPPRTPADTPPHPSPITGELVYYEKRPPENNGHRHPSSYPVTPSQYPGYGWPPPPTIQSPTFNVGYVGNGNFGVNYGNVTQG